MIITDYVNGFKVTLQISCKHNKKTDSSKFEINSIHIEDIFFEDFQRALNVLNMDVVDFTELFINNYYRLN